MLITEVKLNAKKINLELLREKASKLVNKQKNYSVKYTGYSLDDMGKNKPVPFSLPHHTDTHIQQVLQPDRRDHL